MISKGEWITNIRNDEKEAWISAGFIVWNPKPTETCNEQELIKMGVSGVYANPLNPDAKFPTEFYYGSKRRGVYL